MQLKVLKMKQKKDLEKEIHKNRPWKKLKHAHRCRSKHLFGKHRVQKKEEWFNRDCKAALVETSNPETERDRNRKDQTIIQYEEKNKRRQSKKSGNQTRYY